MDPIFNAARPPSTRDDLLLPLLLRIARRADELARGALGNATRDRETWRRAETEFLSALSPACFGPPKKTEMVPVE